MVPDKSLIYYIVERRRTWFGASLEKPNGEKKNPKKFKAMLAKVLGELPETLENHSGEMNRPFLGIWITRTGGWKNPGGVVTIEVGDDEMEVNLDEDFVDITPKKIKSMDEIPIPVKSLEEEMDKEGEEGEEGEEEEEEKVTEGKFTEEEVALGKKLNGRFIKEAREELTKFDPRDVPKGIYELMTVQNKYMTLLIQSAFEVLDAVKADIEDNKKMRSEMRKFMKEWGN